LNSPIEMNIGIIGVGGFGARHYQDLLREVEQGHAAAAAACIINPEEVPEKTARLQSLGCRIYPDADAFFAGEQGRLDLVMIPTGIATHRPLTERALASGAHVFVEKPAAATVEDVEAMQTAEAASGRRVFVGFQHRYDPLTRILKQQLLDGRIGRVSEVRGAGGWPRSPAYYQRNAWAGRLSHNGAPVNDAPFHNAFAHDLLTALCFAYPGTDRAAESLHVEAALYRANAIESCDSAFLHIETDGAPVYLAFSHVCETRLDPEIHVIGEAGKLIWTHARAVWLDRNGAIAEEIPCLGEEPLRAAIFQNIRDVLRGNSGAGPVCTLPMARAATLAATQALCHPVKDVPAQHLRRSPDSGAGERLIWDTVDADLRNFLFESQAVLHRPL
jgi:predicted dehydrogenase